MTTKTAKKLLEYLDKHQDDDTAKAWNEIAIAVQQYREEQRHPKVKCPNCEHEWRL